MLVIENDKLKPEHIIGILCVDDIWLDLILNGTKTWHISSTNCVKWKDCWVGITSKPGEIHGQILINYSTRITHKELLDSDNVRRHQISEEHKASGNSLPPVMICVLNGGCAFFADLMKDMGIDVQIDFINIKPNPF